MPPHATGQLQGAPRRRRKREPQALAAALAAAALAAAPAAEANFGEAPAPAPGREVCRDGKPPRYWDVVDDPLYDKPLGITHPRRAGGCACVYEHIDDLTPERFETYNRQRRPLVIAGAMEGWPAMKNWRDNAYLTEGAWGKHVFARRDPGTGKKRPPWEEFPSPTDKPCRFARKLQWQRVGRERYDAWMKACEVRVKKVAKRYRHSKYGAQGELLAKPHTLAQVVDELFGAGKGKQRVRKKWYGTYILLDTSLFDGHPRLWEANIGTIPKILDPSHDEGPRDFTPGAPGRVSDYPSKEVYRKVLAESSSRSAGGSRSLLLGGPMSRSSLHLDGFGWTSWIAVVRGTKLFYLWPTDLDYKAAFQLKDPTATPPSLPNFEAELDPFAEQSPELEAKFAESGRAFGDELWDWEARDAFSAARSSPLPPMKPAECIVREGEMIVSWENWHVALNVEASMAVTGNFIDKFTLPLYLWRVLTYSGSVRSWVELATSVYQTDHVTFFEALKVIRNLS